MPLLSPRLLVKSFRYALRGLGTAWRQERNFQIQALAGLGVISLMFLVRLARWEIAVLLIVITLVLVLELLNSMFEKLADLLEPRIHAYVRTIKDLMAALVLVASIAAAVIGLIIFIPHLVS